MDRPDLRLCGWRSRPVVIVALFAVAAGFGQFGAVAALGDVAKTFGHQAAGATFADQAGISGTKLGIGLAILRLASLGGLPLAGLADRFGRKPVMVGTCALGLAITMVAAASPGYWWFVVIFACGRPLLSATTGVAQVAAAELTSTADRAKAVALVAAGYGFGAGLTAIIHSSAGGTLGFRGLFLLAVIPLAGLAWLRRGLVEPGRFTLVADPSRDRPVLGPVGPEFRSRLLIVAALSFGVSVITGPSNSLVFIYAQNIRHLSGPVISLMVVGGGLTGLAGLLLGRALADRVGRRPTVALGIAAVGLSGVIAYSGSTTALVIGYELGVLAGGTLAPAAGALTNELFPTRVRASVIGWTIAAGVLGAVVGLLVFGAIADAGSSGNHSGVAALFTFLPIIPIAALILRLPETMGTEPEELWG